MIELYEVSLSFVIRKDDDLILSINWQHKSYKYICRGEIERESIAHYQHKRQCQ